MAPVPVAPNPPGDPALHLRFDSPEQAVYLALWRSYDRLRGVEEEFFARWDLTAQQYNVLRLLQARGGEPLATQQLAQRMISRAPDITRMVDKLERRGLAERSGSVDDRRTVLVGITSAGLQLLDELAGPVQAMHRAQAGHLSCPEMRALCVLLERVREPHEAESSGWRRGTFPDMFAAASAAQERSQE